MGELLIRYKLRMERRVMQVDIVAGLHRRPEDEFVLAERNKIRRNSRIVLFPIRSPILHTI